MKLSRGAVRLQWVKERPSAAADPGNEEGFEAFYERSLPGALRLGHLLTGSISAGQDVAQDAMIAVHARWDQIEQPSAYLRTTVVNLSRSVQRRSIRERLHLRGLPESVTTIPDVDETWRELRRLAPTARAVVVLRFYEDLSLAEIAGQLDMPLSTVKTTLYRALSKLKEVLP